MAWLAGLSIGKKIALGIALIGALAGLVWGVNRLFDSIREDGRNEIRAQWNVEKAARASIKTEFTSAINAALTPQFDALADRVGNIDRAGSSISLNLPRALAEAPRYASADCSLTKPVLDQINQARALSASPQP